MTTPNILDPLSDRCFGARDNLRKRIVLEPIRNLNLDIRNGCYVDTHVLCALHEQQSDLMLDSKRFDTADFLSFLRGGARVQQVPAAHLSPEIPRSGVIHTPIARCSEPSSRYGIARHAGI